MSAARTATPDNVVTTDFGSFDEVARKVFPHVTETVEVSKFFKLLNEEQKTTNEDFPGNLQYNGDLIDYLNKLSEAVREEQKGGWNMLPPVGPS
jgi:hypothetical protein